MEWEEIIIAYAFCRASTVTTVDWTADARDMVAEILARIFLECLTTILLPCIKIQGIYIISFFQYKYNQDRYNID